MRENGKVLEREHGEEGEEEEEDRMLLQQTW